LATVTGPPCFTFDDKNRIVVNEAEWTRRSKELARLIAESVAAPLLTGMAIIRLFYSIKD
jgi:hypothetical protein